MSKCLHKLVYVTTRVKGKWTMLVGSDGRVEWTNTDEMNHSPRPKYGECADCGKKAPNPLFTTKP